MLAVRAAARRRGAGTVQRRCYATTPNPSPVKPSPIVPQAPLTQPTATIPKKKRRTGLRLLAGSTLLTATFYGGSLYASQLSERYRDFFTTEVPLGEVIVHAWEDRNGLDKTLVKKLSNQAKAAAGKTDELQKSREQRMAEFMRVKQEQAAKKAAEMKDKLEQAGEKAQKGMENATSDIKDKAQHAGEVVKDKASQALHAAKQGADDATDALKNGAHTTAQQAENAKDAVAEAVTPPKVLPYTKETLPVDYQRPRQLDASPQPPKVAPAEPYTAPLPVGFEPPPGYAVPRASKASAATTPSVPAPAPAPEPLPLVAPTVSDLSASEPVLGQLAGTIDSLAKYLNDSPSVIGGKGAREVISTASLDLQNLGKRLNAIKDEEKVKLDQVLQEKTKEYNDSLLSAERELVERLENQEDDWKSLFDNERKQLVEAYKEKLNGELEVQKELIEQRLKEEVISKGIELQRDWLAQVKSRVEEERNGRLGKLENLQGEIENLSKTTLGSADWLNENREINKLWTAIRSAWKASVDADSPTPASFNKELSALLNVARSSSSSSSQSAAADDTVISNVISTIPPSIASEGVETLSVLSTWFNTRLSPKILKASFFPQNGGFISYLSSSFLSLFLFKGNTEIGFVQGDDVVSVLSRAQAYLLNRDLDSAVREINQLNGWPKILARDWLVAARKHLEVRQALQIVEAEASLKTLLIL